MTLIAETLTAAELDAVSDRHPDAAYVVMTPEGHLREWDDAAVALLGWTPQQALGRRMMDLTVPAELHSLLDANHATHLELEGCLRARRFEVDHVARDGRRFLAEVHCYPVLDHDELTLHAFLSDASIRPGFGSEQRLAAIVAGSADAILAVDGERRVTDWNPAAETLLGWPRAAMIGMPVDAIVPPRLREQSQAAWRTAARSAGFVRIDTQRQRPDGSLVDVEMTLTRLTGPEAPLACSATYRDISARRRSEHELTAQRSRLRAQRVAERTARAAPKPRRSTGSDPDRSLAERILEFARSDLGMDVAWLAELDAEQQILQVVAGEPAAFGLHEDQRTPRAQTICARVVDADAGTVRADVRGDPSLSDLPGLRASGIGAYVGVPVRLGDGRVYGTLCVVDRAARPEFGDRELALLTLLADILADQIERRRADASDARREAEATALSALVGALNARDQYTGEHSDAVVELSVRVAEALGASEEEVTTVGRVAMLQDLGKVGIPDSILHKPGPLTDLEWDLMREHPAIGARIVAALTPLAHIAPAIHAEHERWDGRGYPDGLAAREIPLASRITFACDAYHAMVSDRPYRRALPRERALAQLRENAGTQFDPAVVDALVAALRT